jgi:hypothetical protein
VRHRAGCESGSGAKRGAINPARKMSECEVDRIILRFGSLEVAGLGNLGKARRGLAY